MPTYVYETIPRAAGERVRRFEVEQRMSDAALTTDPSTGRPVRRVPAGGIGVITGAGADEVVPCASGGCMLPREQAERDPCGGGLCDM